MGNYGAGPGSMQGGGRRRGDLLPHPVDGGHGDPPVWCVPHALIAEDAVAASVAAKLKDWGQSKVTNKALGEGLRRLSWADGGALASEVLGRLIDDLDLAEGSLTVDCIMVPAMMPAIGPATDPVPANPADLTALRDATRNNVTVAVVDTGSYRPAGRLRPRVKASTSPDPIDENGDGIIDYRGACHGGAIAGIIASNCGARVSTFNALVPGQTFMCDSSVYATLVKAKRAGADVINMSWGSYRTARDFPIATNRFVQANSDILFVAAAGNDGTDHEWYPAALAATERHVLSVGAYDTTRPGPATIATFSNFGPWVMAYAPGVDVITDYVSGLLYRYTDGSERLMWGAAYWSGTSFAAPAVAAAVVTATDDGGKVLETWHKLRDGAPLRLS